MNIALMPRTRENVSIYFQQVQDEKIKRFLPQKARSVAEAIEAYEQSLLPDSSSYGKSIYVDSNYVGDIWVYCIGNENPDDMLSFCILIS